MIMKKLLLLTGIILSGVQVNCQDIQFPPSGENQKATTSQSIGLVNVSITYSRPNVTGPNGEDRRGKIWGGLIPFGQDKGLPWRAGANERTTIEVSHDVLIDNNKLPAGRYGLMIFVEKLDSWTVIFSRDDIAWGAFGYKKENDVLRIKCQVVDTDYTEWLTYGFDNPTQEKTSVFLKWENKKITFEIAVPDHRELYVRHFRDALKKPSVLFHSGNWQWAADYCADNNLNLEEALTWAERSMAPGIGVETFSTLSTKAKILKKLNRAEESNTVMDKAVRSTTASATNIDGYARELLSEKNNQKAYAVFKLNEERFPDQMIPSVGLADYYAATGDKKQEIRYLQKAIQNANERQKARAESLQKRLDALKG